MSAAASNGEPVLKAFRCFATGKTTPLAWEEAKAAFANRGTETGADGWLWLHLDRADADARQWLYQGANLSEELAEALTADDTRPRAAKIDDGALLILRGRKKGSSSPQDPMVSMRLFITPHGLLSVRLRPFSPIYALTKQIEAGSAPSSPGAFVGRMVEVTMTEIEATLDELDARLANLETLAFAAPSGQLRVRRNELNMVRRAVMSMKRFMKPQSEALHDFASLDDALTQAEETPGLQEAAHQAARVAEDLEAMRESAALVNEEMQARIADRLNNTMVRLTTVSTVFLPLSFATGLLGVNLAGIPFAQQGWAFTAFAALLAAVGAAAIYIVRQLGERK